MASPLHMVNYSDFYRFLCSLGLALLFGGGIAIYLDLTFSIVLLELWFVWGLEVYFIISIIGVGCLIYGCWKWRKNQILLDEKLGDEHKYLKQKIRISEIEREKIARESDIDVDDLPGEQKKRFRGEAHDQ